ncbi:bifunctional DNA-formamidopyrimidine glycosylase/DNA-(apurinic or apyrimidinic site) lyase [Methylocystis heyeri]|uniref:Formamidopyrimidine-DNA glycosylase n=1 Tax=Methylocystis heyeri TaxID=391905 RepID=A0A6B8KJT2_9HYPH|nr:bifunctional DNA-formamidopyrimidine glycosylase/DNA-(apurinic or apyrimidinic site) lyase [Methylocystis heyeri]QGM46843.1 bifunctional DNA-formamidopyrimidine glycosylase/DNA-(apurinic or apyrimidinic site) lyase [Methylocystis heyeri]
MPELPEVETVRRGLAPVFEGARFARVDQRRADLRVPFPKDFAKRLAGRRVEALRRRAKYLIAELDDGEALVMHLGMSGSFRIEKDQMPAEGGQNPAHDHVVFEFDNGARVTYNDPRRFGCMVLAPAAELEQHPLFAGLGVEPLGNEMNAQTLADELNGRKTTLKAALLDQRNIAGLGNIYVCEALHRAGLSPFRAAGSVVNASGKPSQALERLARAIREVLLEAIEAGGSSLRDHRQTDGSLGYFQHNFRVYDREGEPCPTKGCKGVIARKAQNGRSTFYCPVCQK